MITSPSGMDAGSSKPNARNASIATTASPMKNTTFPAVPVCQPITASLTPRPEPAYQSMNVESARISPEIQAIRSPAAQMPSAFDCPYTGGGGDPPAGWSR